MTSPMFHSQIVPFGAICTESSQCATIRTRPALIHFASRTLPKYPTGIDLPIECISPKCSHRADSFLPIFILCVVGFPRRGWNYLLNLVLVNWPRGPLRCGVFCFLVGITNSIASICCAIVLLDMRKQWAGSCVHATKNATIRFSPDNSQHRELSRFDESPQ